MNFELKGTHVMVDLETFSTASDAAIVSIGAVAFNGEDLIDHFYSNITLSSSTEVGLHIDPTTIMWWLEQSDDARKALRSHEDLLPTALLRFTSWYPEGAPLWGNGASFDNVILDNAYKKAGITPPWKFWSHRCYRTIKSMFKDIPPPIFSGTEHNALHDAAHQAKHLILIAKGA